ncbi:hypothetical protein LAZ67_1000977 [Cordylochernes scorpioides]|uniref:Uncharacterized protein n=1 Tax=Cordylochernes scorpioides TaxID=51811 RepID=A0ABY6JV19_9ARAC|nr:hypothetical protein LAZ67_1000977 [Cordylochernes scorpioides]
MYIRGLYDLPNHSVHRHPVRNVHHRIIRPSEPFCLQSRSKKCTSEDYMISRTVRSTDIHFHGATTGERVHLRTPFCNSFFYGEKLNCGQYSLQISVSLW